LQAVSFELVLCIGHLLGRDENLYSFFEGHKIDGSNSRADARMQHQAAQMQQLAALAGSGGGGGGPGSSAGGAGDDQQWRQGASGGGLAAAPGSGSGTYSRRSLDSHPLYAYNRPGSGSGLCGLPGAYPNTRAQQSAQEQQRRQLLATVQEGMGVQPLARPASLDTPAVPARQLDAAASPFSLPGQQQQGQQGQPPDSLINPDLISPALLDLYRGEAAEPPPGPAACSSSSSSGGDDDDPASRPMEPMDSTDVRLVDAGRGGSGAPPPVSRRTASAHQNAREEAAAAAGAAPPGPPGPRPLSREGSRLAGGQDGLLGLGLLSSARAPPLPPFPPRFLFSCCVGRSRSKARYSLAASAEVADLLEALVAGELEAAGVRTELGLGWPGRQLAQQQHRAEKQGQWKQQAAGQAAAGADPILEEREQQRDAAETSTQL
jgi:hypothetical protein